MNSDAPAVVSIRDVHKAFGTAPVLRGLDLEVAPHEVVVLVGASGSGKSTLLRCINGLEPVDAGSIIFDGIDICEPRADLRVLRRRIGIVFQQFNLFPHRSVLANITLAPRRVLGQSRATAEERARELLARFGLADKADSFPERLSGGQQQRVAIARAIAMDPEVLLLDEVTSALDPALVGEVLDAIGELAVAGMTMVMATHEMAFAREVADRVCFLDGGVVLEQAAPEQFFDAPREARTREFLARVRR